MEQSLSLPLKELLDRFRAFRVDINTCGVFRANRFPSSKRAKSSGVYLESHTDDNLILRVADVPAPKLTANVHSINGERLTPLQIVPREYEGGFTIWESTWSLVTFLQTELKPCEGELAIDLGCGNGLCGIIALQKGYDVLFQDLNWDVLEETVVPNCLLNTAFKQLRLCKAKLIHKERAALTDNTSQPDEKQENKTAETESALEKPKEASAESKKEEEKPEMDVCNVTLEVTEGDDYRYASFLNAVVGDRKIVQQLKDKDSEPGLSKGTPIYRNYGLVSCFWEHMSDLSKAVMSARYRSCSLIVASECLYRKECYGAITSILRTYLKPSTGVAYIGTKAMYFGMDSGTYDFTLFLNEEKDILPRLTVSVRKTHRLPDSATVLDILEIRSELQSVE
ncbi:Histidine protein methyltransferase 1 -like protein [Babesia sp. Xinjiang]|uniref:Histidine protein methyltransferase 1 -like protein n=1 Tax=Babesia sp. Xinjiang TaxID=462227 RepID=UPI000A226DF5|nr:Histidine protein methyltransferase 1 -like protein [Babesia sp. Xinjiang]XP_028871596.1 Histidine protein methyltransferase 1 -like protein [Babesia sp. Xinjiang]ORM41094.1 Histidine protein methyltransferase 1 -like protein [Babesia sp. Xinjiang]ORM41140.1 Histidine protein methyltransferase 1 -like protein [Babesia sp. Xinjiang]